MKLTTPTAITQTRSRRRQRDGRCDHCIENRSKLVAVVRIVAQYSVIMAKNRQAGQVKERPKRMRPYQSCRSGHSANPAADVAEVFRRFKGHNPEPKGNCSTPIRSRCWSRWSCRRKRPMSGQQATPALFARRHAGADGKARAAECALIKTIGLYRTRRKTSLAIEEAHGRARRQGAANARTAGGAARFGRKTANVVMNIAFAEPTIAVDTHLFRVGNRTGWRG